MVRLRLPTIVGGRCSAVRAFDLLHQGDEGRHVEAPGARPSFLHGRSAHEVGVLDRARVAGLCRQRRTPPSRCRHAPTRSVPRAGVLDRGPQFLLCEFVARCGPSAGNTTPPRGEQLDPRRRGAVLARGLADWDSAVSDQRTITEIRPDVATQDRVPTSCVRKSAPPLV